MKTRESRKWRHWLFWCLIASGLLLSTETMGAAEKSDAEELADMWGRSVIAKAHDEKDEEKRLEILDSAIKEGQESRFMDDLILWKAKILRGQGEIEKAIDTLQSLEANYPDALQDRFPGFEMRASMYGGVSASAFEAMAAEYLNSAPIRTIDNARLELAEIYLTKKDDEKATEYLRKVIEDNEETYKKSEPWLEPGKRHREVIWDPKNPYLSIMRPEISSYWRLLGILELQGKDSEAADVAFEIAKKYPRRTFDFPGTVNAYTRYLCAAEKIGKEEEAVRKLEELKSEEKAEDISKAINEAIKNFKGKE